MILKKLKLKFKKENKKRKLNKKVQNKTNLKVQYFLKVKSKYSMMIFKSLHLHLKLIKMIIKLFHPEKM